MRAGPAGRTHQSQPARPPTQPPFECSPPPFASILPLLAAIALALTASLALAAPGSAATPAAAAKACQGRAKAPGKVTFTRARGQAFGWLRWTKPKAARGKVRYRVTVDGKRRKATTARRLKVRVRPGQKLRFKVATTRAPRCGRALKATAKFYAPTTPANVAAAHAVGDLGPAVVGQVEERRRQARRLPRDAQRRDVPPGRRDDRRRGAARRRAEHPHGRVGRHARPRVRRLGAGRGRPEQPRAGRARRARRHERLGVRDRPVVGAGRAGLRPRRRLPRLPHGTLLGQVAGTSYVASNLAPGRRTRSPSRPSTRTRRSPTSRRPPPPRPPRRSRPRAARTPTCSRRPTSRSRTSAPTT